MVDVVAFFVNVNFAVNINISSGSGLKIMK